MLLAENDLGGAPDDAVRRDPEVLQARKIAGAARSRLLACVAGPQEVIDLPETQRMFDKLKEAQALAEDAEDRVLVHRGLLTPAEAERRAAARRPGRPAGWAGPGGPAGSAARSAQDPTEGAGPARPAGFAARYAKAGARVAQFNSERLPTVPPAARRVAASVLVHALIPAAAGFAGATIARRRR